MKLFILLFFIVFFISCQVEKKPEPPDEQQPPIKDLNTRQSLPQSQNPTPTVGQPTQDQSTPPVQQTSQKSCKEKVNGVLACIKQIIHPMSCYTLYDISRQNPPVFLKAIIDPCFKSNHLSPGSCVNEFKNQEESFLNPLKSKCPHFEQAGPPRP